MQSPIPALVAALCLMLPMPALSASQAQADSPAAAATRDGAHDFDWEIGTWKTRLRRLAKPLSGSHEWLEYEGTSVVRAALEA